MVTKGSSHGTGRKQMRSFLQEPQEVGFRELWFSQPHLSLGGGDGVNNPGNILQI